MKFQIEVADVGERLDVFLAKKITEHSRSYLQKLIKEGAVSVAGEVVTSPRTLLRSVGSVKVELPQQSSSTELVAEDFAYDILFEDESMLVIDKPWGAVVHPGAGNVAGTVVNALLGRYPNMAESFANDEEPELQNRPGIVHRLDKDTSGALVVAKTPSAQYKLSKAFADRNVHKSYLAIVRGVPRSSGRIETLIGRHPVNRQKMAVVSRNGKNAITLYKVIGSGVVGRRTFSLVEVDILTGRTHQIRVHMAHLGFPVVGDATYGGVCEDIPVERQQLHAWRVVLPHPVSGEELTIKAPIPEDMRSLIDSVPKGENYV